MERDTFLGAVIKGDEDAIGAALRVEPELARLSTDDGTTPLHLATRHGWVGVAEMLLAAGADVDARTSGEERRTALHDSYEFGQDAVTRLLLERGAEYDINVAAARGDFERVRTILTESPELVNDDSTGLRPLGWAGYGQDPNMVTFLVIHGADLDDELCCPCATGNTAILQAFLDAGADPDVLSDGWQARPLHVAAAMPYSTDSTAVVRMLLAAGADPEALAADGTSTPLDLAKRKQAECDPLTDKARHVGYESVIALLEAETGEPR